MENLMCSACGKPIPEHEKYPEMEQMSPDAIECMNCEMLATDSADIDNSHGAN